MPIDAEAILRDIARLRAAHTKPGLLRRVVARLRPVSNAFHNLCAEAHGFRLNPPLTGEEIRSFETTHRVALPADYRDFLANIGNGGAGPCYGLFKLGEMDDGPWREDGGFVGILSEPFPHARPWNDLSGEPDWDEPELEELDRKVEEFDRRYLDTSNVNGAIPICHLGCALRHWLVITGPEAGHVWFDARADRDGLYPLQGVDEDRVSFVQWYQRWLDDALQRS